MPVKKKQRPRRRISAQERKVWRTLGRTYRLCLNLCGDSACQLGICTLINLTIGGIYGDPFRRGLHAQLHTWKPQDNYRAYWWPLDGDGAGARQAVLDKLADGKLGPRR